MRAEESNDGCDLMKPCLIFQAYDIVGKYPWIYDQVAYSILSLMSAQDNCQLASDFLIQVYVDDPERLQPVTEFVDICQLTHSKIITAMGKHRFVHRLKLVLLQEKAETASGPILYLDGDIYFQDKITDKLAWLAAPGHSLMHAYEFDLGKAKNKQQRKLSKIISRVPEYQELAKMGSKMYNAGAIGLHPQDFGLLGEALNFTDRALEYGYCHIWEQMAVSVALGKKTKINTLEDITHHYWDQRKEYSFIISNILQHIHANKMSCAEAVQYIKAHPLNVPLYQNPNIFSRLGRKIAGGSKSISIQIQENISKLEPPLPLDATTAIDIDKNFYIQPKPDGKNWMNPEYASGLVSVIVPTYNRADLICETLGSVFAQTYRPIEILVIDDGSTDNTEEVVKSYLANCDEQIKLIYIKQDHAGAQVARNRGCQNSKGEFIQFLDSDDLLSPEKLYNQVKALQESPPASVAYGAWRCLYSNGRNKYGPISQLKPEPSEEKMLRGYLSGTWFCPCHSYLFARQSVIEIGPWDEKLLIRQDTDYLTRTLLKNFRFQFVPGSEVLYRRHANMHIGSPIYFKNHFDSLLYLSKKWYSILEEQKRLKAYENEIASGLFCLAEDAYVMRYSKGLELCYDLINQFFGANGYRLRNTSLAHRIWLWSRRYLARPGRRVLGEPNIEIAKTIFRKIYRHRSS